VHPPEGRVVQPVVRVREEADTLVMEDLDSNGRRKTWKTGDDNE
jgi:hypothetical protein